MKAIQVRVIHPKGGMTTGKIVRYDRGDKNQSPFYIIDIGEYKSIRVPAHKVLSENFDEFTKQYNSIFAEVQRKLQEKCFPKDREL